VGFPGFPARSIPIIILVFNFDTILVFIEMFFCLDVLIFQFRISTYYAVI